MCSEAFASSVCNGIIIALISTIAASSVLFGLPTFMSNNMATAQTQPSSFSHSHIPGFFYNPQDPFHSIFPIRNIETSPLLDKAGDAVSTTGNPAQSNLKISSHAMTADGNCVNLSSISQDQQERLALHTNRLRHLILVVQTE